MSRDAPKARTNEQLVSRRDLGHRYAWIGLMGDVSNRRRKSRRLTGRGPDDQEMRPAA